MFNELIRKAKMVFTTVKLIQQYKVNIFESRASEDAERFQDYGFAAQPSEGEGLVIDAGGSVIVLRIDRLKDRPTLANDEVAVWHKEGHKIHLKADQVIEVSCKKYKVTATEGVEYDTPQMTNTGEYSGRGDVKSGGQVSDSTGTMQSMRNTYNGHDHNETDSVTNAPNQSM